MKILNFLSTCNSQFLTDLKINLGKMQLKRAYLQIFQLEQGCYFPIIFPFEKM